VQLIHLRLHADEDAGFSRIILAVLAKSAKEIDFARHCRYPYCRLRGIRIASDGRKT
jgi:hypothetical protein